MFLDATDLTRDQRWLGMTDADLERRAELRPGRLSKYRTGRGTIGSDERRRLSKALADRRSEIARERGTDDYFGQPAACGGSQTADARVGAAAA